MHVNSADLNSVGTLLVSLKLQRIFLFSLFSYLFSFTRIFWTSMVLNNNQNMEAPSRADEETPLLHDNDNDNGTPKAQTDPITQEQTIIADEPSNKRLALVLGSIWIGVFLGALDSTSK